MNDRRRETLRKVVATFAPSDARLDRIVAFAVEAIASLSPRRRADILRLLDLLAFPMKGSPSVRTATLRGLAHSPIGPLRTGFAALKRLALFLAYAESEPGSDNPTWLRIGYPGPRHDRPDIAASLPLAVAADGDRIFADVVVVGSGAAGGVIASAFARAGKHVVVVEAGGAYGPHDFTQREKATSELYLDGGLSATSDLGVVILAGATVGGGTTVNWCTSLRLPEQIAQEWAACSGIDEIGGELAPHYDAIEARLGVRPAPGHNANNRVILDGARALGIHAQASPRNAAAECGDGCGYCGFGCAYGNKRSTAATYLLDITGSGGNLFANTTAIQIDSSGGRARGILARQTIAPQDIRTFRVDAALVVVCAGALRTPALLARSGIDHPLLGKRLFLHPVAAAVAEFDRAIEPWTGPMQTAYSDAFNYRDGNYGAKIEVAPTHPGIAALALPWENGERHAELMNRIRNVATLFALTRDRDPGAIDLNNEAQIRYRVSRFDGENLLAGLLGVFDLAFAAGAVRATTLHTTPIEVHASQWSTRFREEFARRLRAIGVAPNRQILFSAHQMGTATMGTQRNRAVVDPSGRVWSYANLLVADGSVFPQSSGVNPMLTIMAMAQRIAAKHGGVAS